MNIPNYPTSKPIVSPQIEETIKECDNKCIESINYILKKWKMDSILPINLVHSDQITKWAPSIIYEPPSTIIVDDSDEYIQYLYNNTKPLQIIHEILAIIIAGVMRQIRFIANNETYTIGDYRIWLNTKLEVEQYLNHRYKK